MSTAGKICHTYAEIKDRIKEWVMMIMRPALGVQNFFPRVLLTQGQYSVISMMNETQKKTINNSLIMKFFLPLSWKSS